MELLNIFEEAKQTGDRRTRVFIQLQKKFHNEILPATQKALQDLEYKSITMKMDLQPLQNSVERRYYREGNAYGIKISTEGIFVCQNFNAHTCEWFNDVPAEGMVYRTALLPLIQLIQTEVANLTAIRKRENEQAEAILGK